MRLMFGLAAGAAILAGAVAPATVEEVQELVRIASKYKQPMSPPSMGSLA